MTIFIFRQPPLDWTRGTARDLDLAVTPPPPPPLLATGSGGRRQLRRQNARPGAGRVYLNWR